VAYFGLHALWATYGIAEDGLDLWSFGVATCQAAIAIVTLKILVVSRHWNPIFIFSVVISIVAYFGVTLGYEVELRRLISPVIGPS